jgi:hypothetical protein
MILKPLEDRELAEGQPPCIPCVPWTLFSISAAQRLRVRLSSSCPFVCFADSQRTLSSGHGFQHGAGGDASIPRSAFDSPHAPDPSLRGKEEHNAIECMRVDIEEDIAT